ncbi:MAG: acetyl-CoA carboxylase carboxyl transferase subunit beta [Acidobacteria bacterium]|nr:acetyl-CoA carboxylase carboxyl transferase subunit beta [Acidobacteriota bacterium]MDP7340409.1 acetyl-CoA carboxylase carboxyltransferase subunit alpha/beta [Vicinamibacterales bacterium]MDP7480234.1 acetyl-CoA carboxylase carboxyltransferase subunit alpha/beta [Vicinamibacterales bacterium]MDP7690467.1 acetyl-CoA carboxylase carboxyltransferase subunit alpha/beta [Vicinamibacterales bacterium]HJN46120.1 acetyl-CoA carboxylase carboxyltransferase subunit alpha/beta [Vicinamibacterales bact
MAEVEAASTVEPAPAPEPVVHTCRKCNREVDEATFATELRVCGGCGHHSALTALEWIDHLADPGTFREIGKRLFSSDPLGFNVTGPYRERLREAERRTGMQEAALAGEASLEGRPVVLISLEFDFLGGTMGSVVGEKVARAFEIATRRQLPVVSILASGGARIQEGMLALMQMAKTATAVSQHQAAQLPYISVLTNPSFGGTFASFGSLGDILIGEPGAQIGFVGARVVEGTIAEKIPKAQRRAEALLEHGMIDMVVARPLLRNRLAILVTQLAPNCSDVWRTSPLAPTPEPTRTPAEVIELARTPSRPRAPAYVERVFQSFSQLHGDRCYGDDPAILGGVANLQGHPVVLIAQWGQMMPMPEGYRKAQRLLRLAEKCNLPVVTLVDTRGAFPGLEAEHRGIALTIGENLAALAQLPVPIVNVVIGEGGSGGALALGLADVILMQENAIYSVIAPEGAAAILLHDATRSDELLPALKLRAHDLLDLGVIDDIVPEPLGGAHRDPDAAARQVLERVVHHLSQLTSIKPKKLVQRRADRYRAIGRFERGIVHRARDIVARISRSQ